MRRKAKQILGLAVLAALTVAGMSLAAGGSGGGGGERSSSAPATPAVPAANRPPRGPGERGFRAFRGDFADADVRAVLDDIRKAVAKQAPEIAGPVIDKAENDKKITSEQADKLRQAAADIAAGKRPDIRGFGRDEDVHEVIHEAFAAAADKAPGIAAPIIDKAVSDKLITQAQADRITQLVKRGGPGPGFGPGPGKRHFGPGPGRRHFGGPPPIADKDVRAVLEDIHTAVAKQASGIVGPVIDKAEQDGKITAAQADKLRDATKDLVGGKPHGGPPPMLELRDADVRDVLHDAFEALAAKRAGIAKPIIDQAVADKKITEAQANQLRSMLSRKHGPGGFRKGHRPPHFERPGGPGAFGPGGPPPGGPPPGAGPSAQPEAPAVSGSPA